MAELCPLCPCKCIELRTHLAEEHKIAEEAIKRLLLSTASSSLLNDSTSDKSRPIDVVRDFTSYFQCWCQT
uniref:Zf-RVT domain-containing protein n=1 Tax=Loa loa TaxID=7209 RepID=A0A1I7VYL6_LOALO